MLSSFPTFSGFTELTAGTFNALLDQMRRQGRLIVAPPLELTRSGEGWQLRVGWQRGFWAALGAGDGSGSYSWRQVVPDDTGRWHAAPSGLAGGIGSPAVASDARGDLPAGTTVWLEPRPVGGGGIAYTFLPPLATADGLEVFPAAIGGASGSVYGFVEQSLGPTGFYDTPGGRRATADSPGAAIEANGRTGVPAGTRVLLARVNRPGARVRPYLFQSSGSDPGFFVRLVRRPKNSVFTLDLKGATGGTWSLAFDPDDADAAGTTAGTAGPLAAAATAAQIRAALDPLTAGLATVGGSGGVFTVELTGSLGGESAATLSLTGADLTGGTGAATCTQTTTGRDLPFADGEGGYSWERVVADAFGRLAGDGTGSTWPVGLAHETGGEPSCPEGAVVWAVPRASRSASAATAEADPALADWSRAELDDHFSGVADADGTTLDDDRLDFVWRGEISFWAELTDAADAAGLYPFKVVHLGGGTAGVAATPPADDFPAAHAADLRAEFLDDPAGYADTFDTPLAAADRAWVASRPGGPLVAGVAAEVAGRLDVRAGTVVRVFATPAGGTPQYLFAGPPGGLWARVTGGASAGLYPWAELDPPPDPATGDPVAARTGTAAERNGDALVPAGSVVLLEPAAGGGWRFDHRPAEDRDGRDCRLVYWTGGASATVVAGPEDAAADDRVVPVTVVPAADAHHLGHGHHLAYKLRGSAAYVIPVPYGDQSPYTPGHLTTFDQVVGGDWTLGAGGLVAAGTAATPFSTREDLVRFTPSPAAAEVYTPGQFGFMADGSLRADQSGPEVGPAGGRLEVRGGPWAQVVTTQGQASASTPFAINSHALDGVTGTYPLPARADGVAGSVTFSGGLYVSSADPTDPPALWSGQFTMGVNWPLSSPPYYRVTVSAGMVSEIETIF